MKITSCKQAVVLHLPPLDLGYLCFLPEMQRLMAQFPRQFRVNLLSPPCFLALTRPIVPLLLATPTHAPVLLNVQRSLRTAFDNIPPDGEHQP